MKLYKNNQNALQFQSFTSVFFKKLRKCSIFREKTFFGLESLPLQATKSKIGLREYLEKALKRTFDIGLQTVGRIFCAESCINFR